MEIFLAGIIQGSERGTSTHDQSYRGRIRAVLKEAFPEATIYSPAETYTNSVMYDDRKGKKVFSEVMRRAGEADLLIAYVPEASMGTAIEMWIAFHAGKKVVAISPMKENWSVKFLSHRVCSSLDEFERFVRSGSLRRLFAQQKETA
jgi:nucleoside 2-deoxyribosyltransferase